ncbi:MAG: hypothetical protein LBD74_06745 [Spirochaetaceae bacterium]|nr:hypothetical protein [Spirochaetaceae bacterium]
MENFFGAAFEPQEGQWYCWNTNGARGYIQKKGERWYMAFQALPFTEMTGGFAGPLEVESPGDLPRSVMIDPGNALVVYPVLNEKPYLVPLTEKLSLVPAGEVRLTVLFPPVLVFETPEGQRIGTFTPFTCAEAWFGDDTAQGMLCASLPASCLVWEDAEALKAPPSLIRCPLRIHNHSKTPLELDRLAIYTEPLSIYNYEGLVWTDTVVMDCTVGGNIEMNLLPDIPESYRKIRGPVHSGMGDILIRQGADFIKNITSL